MKKTLLVILCSVLWSIRADAQTAFYQGQNHSHPRRHAAGQPLRFLGAAHRRLRGQIYSRQLNFIVQNMPGAGHVVAVNHLYTVAKPGRLTLIGSVIPSLYLESTHRPARDSVRLVEVYMDRLPGSRRQPDVHARRHAYKTIEEVRTAKEPPKCGATGVTGPDSYFPKLLQETGRRQVQHRHRLPGGTDIDLGVERGEIHCRAFTIEAFSAANPIIPGARPASSITCFRAAANETPGCRKRRRSLNHGSNTKQRNPAGAWPRVLLGADDMGRPMFGPPGMPADRLKTLARRLR